MFLFLNKKQKRHQEKKRSTKLNRCLKHTKQRHYFDIQKLNTMKQFLTKQNKKKSTYILCDPTRIQPSTIRLVQ